MFEYSEPSFPEDMLLPSGGNGNHAKICIGSTPITKRTIAWGRIWRQNERITKGKGIIHATPLRLRPITCIAVRFFRASINFARALLAVGAR